MGEPIVSLLGLESCAQEKKKSPSSTLHNRDKKHIANSHIDFFINDNLSYHTISYDGLKKFDAILSITAHN